MITMTTLKTDYFDWHREQTLNINKCNFNDYKYILLQCSGKERKCGGVADRLKSLPFFIAAGAYYKRIFLIRWQRPTKLEDFLIPNEINWSVPDWMHAELDNLENTDRKSITMSAKEMFRWLKRYGEKVVIGGLLQDFFGGSSFYYQMDSEMDDNKELDEDYLKKFNDIAGWSDYEILFRDLFYTLFELSPPIAKLVHDKLKSANLVPGKFSTCQYRAFYGVENKKLVVDEDVLTQKSRNALNCASSIQPGDPIFFASDSQVAVRFARKMSETTDRKIVVFDEAKEALHLDKRYQWTSGNVSDFYPTFVDLFIMAEAKCMSHGVGGFGRFANLLSIAPDCVIRHDNEKANKRESCEWIDSATNGTVIW
jgi:hypothetical protein